MYPNLLVSKRITNILYRHMKIAMHVFEPLIYRCLLEGVDIAGPKHLSHECETRHKVTLGAEQAGNLEFGMHFLLGLISICKQICVLWQVNGLIVYVP